MQRTGENHPPYHSLPKGSLRLAKQQIGHNIIAYNDGLLRFYGMASKPEELSDEDWAMRVAVLEKILKEQRKN